MATCQLTILDMLGRLCDDGVIRLTPGQAVQVEALLCRRREWPLPVLVQSLAALLAMDQDNWGEIAKRLRYLLAHDIAGLDADGDVENLIVLIAPTPQPALPAKPQPTEPRFDNSSNGKPRPNRWRIILASGVALALVVVGVIVWSWSIGKLPLPADTGLFAAADLQSPLPPEPTLSLTVGDKATVVLETAPEQQPEEESETALELPSEAEPKTASELPSEAITGADPTMTLLVPASRIDIPAAPAPDYQQHISPWLWFYVILAVLAAIAGPIAVMAAVRAPTHTRARHRREAEKAMAKRAELAKSDTGTAVPYHIPRYLPLARTAINDAAGTLGLIGVDSGGRDLDVPATLRHTLRRAGELQPYFAARQRPTTILALVDMEAGDHPCADDVDLLLTRWRKVGVAIERYHYSYRPYMLRPAASGPPVSLERLARRRPNAVVLVLSALVHPEDRGGRASWIPVLAEWPAAAVIDLDPRPVHERAYDIARVRDACADAGLGPFPFSDEGIQAAARHLAGEPLRPPPWPPLASIDKPLIADAVRCWATCAAYVPQPDWRQLEALRRHDSLHAEIGRHLTEPGYVVRLIEWLIEQPEVRAAVTGGGTGLNTPDGLEDRLIAEQRHRDGGSLERRARRIIFDQLKQAEPQSEYAKVRREFKLACHLAVLDPARVEELLEKFRGSPLEPELREFLQREGRLQQEGAVVARWRTHNRDSIRDWVERRVEVTLATLAWPSWARWQGAVLAIAAAFMPVLLGAILIAKTTVARDYTVPPIWQAPMPEVDAGALAVDAGPVDAATEVEASPVPPPRMDAGARRIRPTIVVDAAMGPEMPAVDAQTTLAAIGAPVGSDVLPDVRAPETVFAPEPAEIDMRATTNRPALVSIRGGQFQMGSPVGEADRDSDEGPQHTVRITRFLMCRTEITQENWEAVMGNNPSYCDYGCGAKLPVQNINWLDAIEYLNKLSELEGLTPCYRQTIQNLAWDRSCTGYRLPTEAEWEYATRAGTTTAYSFGDDASELDEYAWYPRNSGNRVQAVGTKRANPWGLYDMHGNVWEWVWDWYGPYPSQTATDPTGPESGSLRVLRGGSFWFTPWDLRSAGRDGDGPGYRLRDRGLRCVRAGARA